MAKAKPKRDEVRENRIMMEIVVDAYGPEEQAMGWYYYLDEQLQFPFTTTCIAKRATSPLRMKDEVEVLGMAVVEECESEMFVNIRWDRNELAIPLSQLMPIPSTDEPTIQAVEDWHYWIRMGYRFG
jgi:hypothetical protein